jgi:hypothetical protein
MTKEQKAAIAEENKEEKRSLSSWRKMIRMLKKKGALID